MSVEKEQLKSEISTETDPVVEMEAKELEQTSQEVDEIVSLNEPEAQSLSETEKADLKAGTNIKVVGYWRDRLISELDFLPDNIKPIVQKLAQNVTPRMMEYTFLYQYIKKRVTVLQRKEAMIKAGAGKLFEMAQLKQRLKDIDERKDYEQSEQEQRRTVFCDQDDRASLFVIENEAKKKLTIGDIVADYHWGVKYRPDNSLPDGLWRRIRKLSDYIEARRNIEYLYNREIMYMEGRKLDAGVMYSLSKLRWRSSPGLIAERMAPSFLLRMQYNHPELGFRVEHANVIEDVYLKYDFKIRFPRRLRGVRVEGDTADRDEHINQAEKSGFQYTTSTNISNLKEKGIQIRKAKKLVLDPKFLKYIKKPVDDIVLMSMPLIGCKKDFSKWFDNGRSSGGPEQYMSIETKKTLIKKAFQGRIELTDEEIDKLASE